jgi:2-dehydropantoate 2-reductase
MKKTEIAIIGLGGVGGYFGFKLAQSYATSNDVAITFVTRGKTYETVKENGLILLSPEHSNSVAKPDVLLSNIDDLQIFDIIIICVKEYDLENICLSLKDKIIENTVLIPLMNGVDIYERIRKTIKNGIVLPTCVYVASHIKESGIVEHKGGLGKIVLGKDPQNPDFEPKNVVELLLNAGINVDYKENSFPDIWIKFFFIASFGLVTARYNKTMGELRDEPHLRQRATLIMQEIALIAEKKGIAIPENIIEKVFTVSQTLPYHTPTSVQLDVQAGKKHNELALFAGAIIKYGEEMNVEVPETVNIYKEIKEFLVDLK